MKQLAEMVIALLELLEAEGRDFKRGAFNVALAVSLLVVAVLLAAGGATLLVASLFVFLQGQANTEIAALVCGLVLLFAAGGIAWQAKRMTE